MKRSALAVLVASVFGLLSAVGARGADLDRYTIFEILQSGFCQDGIPRVFNTLDAVDSEDCSVGGGEEESICACINGAIVPVMSAGGGSITVEEADSSPSVSPTTVLQFGTGFTVTDEGSDQAQVDLNLVLLPSSLEYPPANPGTYDDEFNSTTLDPAWTIVGTATTPTVGDVNPFANVTTTPIYNLDDQWPGWLLIQSDDPSGETIIFQRSYTPATDETFFMHVAPQLRSASTAGEGSFHLLLTNSGDANEAIFIGITRTSSGTMWEFGVNNNGTPTPRLGAAHAFGFFPFADMYLMLWKTGDVYNGYILADNGFHTQMGALVTKTGVTTFDQIQLRVVTANETPSIINGVDFLRYYASNTFEVMNEIEVAGAGGGGGDSIRVEDGDNAGTFTAASDADFDDSGDINFARAAGPPDVITATVRADAVALTTDTTGNYVSSATANQGLLVTGTEGASVGLDDCPALNIWKRNAGDTAWECTTDATGATDHGALTGLGDDDHSQYLYLQGRPGGQGSTVAGGTLTGNILDFRANTFDADTSYLSLSKGAIVLMPDESNPSEEFMLEPGFGRFVFDASANSVQFSLFGTGERARIEFSGILGVDVGIRGGQSDSDANSTCLSVDSDRWYGDLDCSRTKGGGEQYLDEAAATPPDIDAVTGQSAWDTAATKTTADLTISGVEVDFESGASEGYPRLAQSITAPSADCDATDERGRLYYDQDDGDGNVQVCRGDGEGGVAWGPIDLSPLTGGAGVTFSGSTIALDTSEASSINVGTVSPAFDGAFVIDTDGDSANVQNDVPTFQSGSEDFIIPAVREYPTLNGQVLGFNSTNDDFEWISVGYAEQGAALNAAVMTDAQTIFFGASLAAPTTTAGINRIYIPQAGTLRVARVYARCTTAGTNQSWTTFMQLNSSTNITIEALSAATNDRTWVNSGLSQALAAGDYLEFRSVNPTWTTNPANCLFSGVIYVSVP